MTSWWSGLAPVTSLITCGDGRHEIRWADGEIAAVAHPQLERERALNALGAEAARCVQIVDAWQRHTDDLDVLMAASRGPSDRLDAPGRARNAAARGRMSRPGLQYATAGYSTHAGMTTRAGWWGASSRRFLDAEAGPRADLPLLLSLGAGLPERLTATVIANWADRIDASDDRVTPALPALDAALYGRVCAALVPWLGDTARVQLSMQPPGAEPVIRREADYVEVGLPFGWLRDVWARNLTVVLDRFCLAADRTEDNRWILTTVDRSLTGPRVLTISG